MTQRSNASKCGTYGGYQRHRRNNEPACDPCKKAFADYMFAYRRDHPADARHNSLRTNARARAALRVAKDYPAVFDTYLQEEMSKP